MSPLDRIDWIAATSRAVGSHGPSVGVAVALAQRFNQERGDTWAPISVLVKDTGCCRSAVIGGLKRIEEAGAITVVRRSGAKSYYRLQAPNRFLRTNRSLRTDRFVSRESTGLSGHTGTGLCAHTRTREEQETTQHEVGGVGRVAPNGLPATGEEYQDLDNTIAPDTWEATQGTVQGRKLAAIVPVGLLRGEHWPKWQRLIEAWGWRNVIGAANRCDAKKRYASEVEAIIQEAHAAREQHRQRQLQEVTTC
jgi:hypothetical protein